MTITIPKPLAIALLVLIGAGALAMFIQELPDITRYFKQVEGL